MLNFLPDNLNELFQNGYLLNKYHLTGVYEKLENDTGVVFYYPSEKVKYSKTVQVFFHKGDSTSMNLFLKRFELSKNNDSIFIQSQKAGKIAYRIYRNLKGGFLLLYYRHPLFKDETQMVAPSASDN